MASNPNSVKEKLDQVVTTWLMNVSPTNKRPLCPRSSRYAFTLIELLTVIAIIGILAALVLPVLGKARARTRQVICMANMKHLGVAVSLYTGDYDGTLPQTDDQKPNENPWFYAVDPYLLNGATPGSPTLAQKLAPMKQDPIWKTFDENTRANTRTIKMNRKLHGKTAGFTSVDDKVKSAQPPHRKKLIIADGGNTVLLFDGRCEESNSGGDKSRFDGYETYVSRRHFDGANVLLVDGHGEWRKEKQQTTGSKYGWENEGTTLQWWGTK